MRAGFPRELVEDALTPCIHGEPSVFQIRCIVPAVDPGRDVRHDAHISVVDQGPAVSITWLPKGSVVRLRHDTCASRNDQAAAPFDRERGVGTPKEKSKGIGLRFSIAKFI